MTPKRPPNILWIFGDQHRAQALSCMGDPNLHTPNIDRLATEGVHFRRAVATNPWCCPFRYSLTTGRYPHQGIDCTPPPAPLSADQPTVATYLKRAGYETCYIGKWHLYGKDPDGVSSKIQIIPKAHRGQFDTWIGYENNNSQYDTWVHGHRHDGREFPSQRLQGYETDALTDLFLAEIDRLGDDQDRPFFAVLSVQPPHVPNVAPAEDMARHNPARISLRPNVPPVPRIEETARRELAGYYAQIENLDRNLGRILKQLQTRNRLDDTLILFFSDHGDCMGSHGYREKSSPWEESIRIPFIIGGGVPYGNRRAGPIDTLLCTQDILPTTLGLAGIPAPPELPGIDLSPCLYTSPATALPEPDSCYLQHTRHKRLEDGLNLPWRGVVTRDGWKYVCIPNAPYGMWNLNEDPYELANLVFNQRFMPQRAKLHARLARWIEETGDPFDLPDLQPLL